MPTFAHRTLTRDTVVTPSGRVEVVDTAEDMAALDLPKGGTAADTAVVVVGMEEEVVEEVAVVVVARPLGPTYVRSTGTRSSQSFRSLTRISTSSTKTRGHGQTRRWLSGESSSALLSLAMECPSPS